MPTINSKKQRNVVRSEGRRKTSFVHSLHIPYYGFTLVELLVVISIIGILIGLSAVAYQNAKSSARDTQRKSDLGAIGSSLEIYRTDCGEYPTSLASSLKGDGSSASCATTNTYIAAVPQDPLGGSYSYSSSGATFVICAHLENGPITQSSGCPANCSGGVCNYKVENP